MEESTKEKIAEILLRLKAVTLKPNDPFKYASGRLGPIYCDNRIILSYPDDRDALIESFVELIKSKNLEFDVVGGTATAGIPHAALIADKLKKPMIYARGQAKDHGKQAKVDGRLKKGQKVLVVEDLINTGGSSLAVIEAIREAGGIVEDCVAIFTYNLKEAEDAFANANCNLITLTDFRTLVDFAVQEKYISDEEKNILFEWKLNPEKWSEAHK
ncbi:orotate phosphoribosyltransferase [Nanoarchaeota archaeon]